MSIISLVIIASILAIAFAAFNFATVKKMDEGTDKMKEIASAIRIGSNAFINYEYKVLYAVVAVVAVLLVLLTSWQAAISLIIGSIMSGAAGLVGMKIATYANVRVSKKPANKGYRKTVKVAFRAVLLWDYV